MTMEISDLKDGDILLFKGNDTVKTAQLILKLNPIKWFEKGSISTIHTGIITSAIGNDAYMAHSAGGVKGTMLKKDGLYRGYEAHVYRFIIDKRAEEAAVVASRWTEGDNNMPYAHLSKVVGAAFHFSGYTKEARKRAKFYAEHKNTRGGPPGTAQEKKSMYCSMFVIACYQAVFGESASAMYMPLDAKNTSPMTLESWLKDNRAWHFIGVIDL